MVTNRAKSAMDDYFDYYPELEERLAAPARRRAGGGPPGRRPGQHLLCPAEGDQGPGPCHLAGQAVCGGRALRRAAGRRHHALRKAGDPPAHCRGGRSMTPPAWGVQEVTSQAIAKYSSVRSSPGGADLPCHRHGGKAPPEQIFSNYAILGRYVLKPGSSISWRNLEPRLRRGDPAHRRLEGAVPEDRHGGRGL